MEKQHQWSIWYFIVTFSALMLLQGWWAEQSSVETIPYSEFLSLLQQNELPRLPHRR